ncbi:MAG: tRNA lysidine(34) synthetase TilS [Lysobacteraceae bacterium]|nr:MAG: tRNA lysidine(34) synthetase TilS [Xanthomonadaceae bacterium]
MHAAALQDAVRRDDGRSVLLGYSGGLDSSVLLHLLANDADARRNGLRALHVHHGLHADADRWVAHCERECASLGIPLQVVRVAVDLEAGLGTEGAARAARHRAFAEALDSDQILALAHHRDDQAETFLLRALRGSGVDGLASMRHWRAHARGWLWRPLLDRPRDDLLAYARRHGLNWIDDPGNANPGFDRNFLRHEVMPLLRRRWPHATDNLARSAALGAQATGLLEAEDVAALAAAQCADDLLDVDALQAVPRERRARVLRRWIDRLGLPPMPGNGIERVERDLLAAREDAGARFDWAGARVQRWRNVLHAGRIRASLAAGWSQAWDGATPLALPTGDSLALVGADRFEAALRVHARIGGERIALPGRMQRHALKHVLQERDVPPWRRERLPLLSDQEGRLLAAGDAILSAQMEAWLRTRGARLQWTTVS